MCKHTRKGTRQVSNIDSAKLPTRLSLERCSARVVERVRPLQPGSQCRISCDRILS